MSNMSFIYFLNNYEKKVPEVFNNELILCSLSNMYKSGPLSSRHLHYRHYRKMS